MMQDEGHKKDAVASIVLSIHESFMISIVVYVFDRYVNHNGIRRYTKLTGFNCCGFWRYSCCKHIEY